MNQSNHQNFACPSLRADDSLSVVIDFHTANLWLFEIKRQNLTSSSNILQVLACRTRSLHSYCIYLYLYIHYYYYYYIFILPHISIIVVAFFLHYCEEIDGIDSIYSKFVKYILKVSHCRHVCNCLLMNNSM